MDRASGYGPEGWGFESLRARGFVAIGSGRLRPGDVGLDDDGEGREVIESPEVLPQALGESSATMCTATSIAAWIASWR